MTNIVIGIGGFFAALTGLALIVEFARVLVFFPWSENWCIGLVHIVHRLIVIFDNAIYQIFLAIALVRVFILPFAYVGIASANYIAGNTYKVLTLGTFMDDLLGCIYLPLLMCLGVFKSLAIIYSDATQDACNAVMRVGTLLGPERALEYAWNSFGTLLGYLFFPWAYPDVQASVASFFGDSASDRLKYANVTSYSITAGYLASCTAKGAFENWHQVWLAAWAAGAHLINESFIIYECFKSFIFGAWAQPNS